MTLRAALALLVLMGFACRSSSLTGPAPPAKATPVECGLPLDESTRALRVAWMHAGLVTAVAKLDAELDDGSGGLLCPPNDRSVNHAVHDFGDYAFAQLSLSPNAAATQRAVSALTCLFSYVSPEGVFPFHLGDVPKAKDNPTEFALLPVAAILRDFTLSKEVIDGMLPKLRASLEAIEAHVVCPGYTNICWIQTAEMLAIGAYFAARDDEPSRTYGKAKVASGLKRLNDWLTYTRQNGITEFASPTYSEVDLEAMLVARRSAPNDAARSQIDAALDYLWTELAANAFPSRGSVAGPHSRSYDPLFGQGGLTLSLWLAGLRVEPPSQPMDLGKAILLVNANAADGYRPPSRALCLSASVPREVRSTFGVDAAANGKERYAWITQDFSLGSTSSDYATSASSDQDVMIRADLASSSKTPALVLLADYLDAPASSVKAGDFTKVTHLLMAPVSAQKKGALLTTLVVPAKDPHYTSPNGTPIPLVNLTTNLTFPASADEVLLVGSPSAVDIRQRNEVGDHPTLVVRIATGAIAVSFVDVSGIECPQKAGGYVVTSKPTFALGPLLPAQKDRGAVARLIAMHAATLPADTSTLAKCFARAAVFLVGERCETPGCAAALGARVAAASASSVRNYNPMTGDWDIVLRPDAVTTLHVHRLVDAEGRARQAGQQPARRDTRDVDGAVLDFPPLAVDGKPVVLGIGEASL